ncbi:HAMP domain-containing histidine kinase [Geitlerinema sp. P-1104]|uniref:sensor histidine kinase n=1 Tax=Geitlerinema sp. P-1104 TaxID=2546230 RepID=UPI0014774FCA|nr:HAMP domain-containing sensor histidine kinase [Geitlerinema sp. P-1104]NMG57991.1 HAMP domain-containing histidine kinase [Geitlerinema sp. P-1104]
MTKIEPKIDRILAVDDSPDNLFLVQAILEEEGYIIDLAEDGFAALEQIESNPPDLILLDVMMPNLDGYDVTRRVRNEHNLPYIPILLITAHEGSSVVKGLDVGADDFIRKPVEMEELQARVRSLLRLKHTIDERDRMAREREDFVSRLTHDLRTPLVAADRMLNLMRSQAFGEISESMDEAMSTMIRSNHNLLDMVNLLLEVYRYEAGRKQLTFAPFDLCETLNEILDELSPIAQDKQLEVVRDFQGGICELVGDRLELYRVFVNLIGNAIKFTDQGKIEVRLSRLEGSNDALVLEVEDTGIGIDKSDHASLFTRFRQGDHKRSGSGLGLHLCQRIIDAHQGEIDVRSEVGQGSLFRIKLPLTMKGISR